jgi:hypothetical protein
VVLNSFQAPSRHPLGGTEDSHGERQCHGQDSNRALPEYFGIRNARIVLFNSLKTYKHIDLYRDQEDSSQPSVQWVPGALSRG